MFKSQPAPRPRHVPAEATPKSEETRTRILYAALDLFRENGFDSTTMRDIATRAEVATGAAYYYYASKDAIITDFYQRSSAEMLPAAEATLAHAKGLQQRLQSAIATKLDYFTPNRGVLRALLRNGADPAHPLSPFSSETKAIRDRDIDLFRRMLIDCGVRIPRDLEPHLPEVLWFYQMGIILFWVIDTSPRQASTARLLELSTKLVATLVRLSALPLMRPLRKTAIELIQLVKGSTA